MLIDNTDFYDIYNLIYFCTACLVVVSALSSEIKKDILLQNELGKYLVVFPLVSLIFLVGFRGYDVGTDTRNYHDILWNNNIEIKFFGEFLFDLIALIFRFFNLSFSFFLFFISFLFFTFVFKASKNYTDFFKSNLFITFFSYMSFFFFLSMSVNVIRQGVSLAVLLLAYSIWLKKGNISKIYLLLLLALSFHLTSIIPIAIFIFSLITKKYRMIPLLLLFYLTSILLSYFNFGFLNISPIILEILDGERRGDYLSGDGAEVYEAGFKPNFVFFNTLFLCISLYVRNKLSNPDLIIQYNILISYYIITSIFLFMAFQLAFSDRWGLFSWFVIPFLIAPLFYSAFIKGSIRIHYVLMLILIYIGFNFYA